MAANYEIVKNSKGKAAVWEHFGFIKTESGLDRKRVGCKICKSIFKYSGNTTNLTDHIQRRHRDVKPEPAKKATCVGLFNASRLQSTSQRAQNITKAITRFIVKDLRPFSVVENSGFKHLSQVYEPRYVVPSRQHFSEKMVPNIYDEVKEEVLKSLKGQHVALTTDGWTSRATQSYITITSSHIDGDWNMKSYVLQTRMMTESHTGVHIAAELSAAMTEWGLPLPSSIPIVSDNASNMIVAAKELGTEFHVGCFAHTLNLACGGALKLNAVANLLGRIRRIVAYFHRSTTAAAILKAKQRLLQLPEHKLVIDVQTRWNSALDMINRYLEQQPAIHAALTSKELRGKEKGLSTLTDSDISTAEELVVVLSPLKIATVALCEERVPTISLIVPLQHQLINNVMNEKETDSPLVRNVKNTVVKDLSKRYTNKVDLVTATLLDPRFKLAPFLNDEDREKAFETLTEKAITVCQAQVVIKTEPADEDTTHHAAHPLPHLPQLPEEIPEDRSPVKKSVKMEQPTPSAMSSLFGDVYITKVVEAKSTNELCVMEVALYKAEPSINACENPLIWWKHNSGKYPKLSLLAKKYLCIPATSVPSERVFSTAGDIVTAQRAALKHEHVDKLIFLKKNWNP